MNARVLQIPVHVRRYDLENTPRLEDYDEAFYEPVAGQKIHVLLWERWPDYDFIFGVPFEDSPKYEKEIGFFQFRDLRASKIRQGFYFDIKEALSMVDGLKSVLDFSKTHSKHLWEKRN